MKPVIFFRHIEPGREEYLAACRHFDVFTQRTLIPPGSLVIPRYSALPHFPELVEDVSILGSQTINLPWQHGFVADIRKYYQHLQGLTPATYTAWHGLPEGSWVLKGTTNSRKNYWKQRMFAPTTADIPRVASSLMDDAEILEQGIVVREYVPLVKYGEGINGLPITNEWRFFVLNGEILASGYYWANDPELYPGDVTKPPEEAVALVQKVIQRLASPVPYKLSSQIPFYVVDVGEKEAGGWIVIELNDGQQSGLPCLCPDTFYRLLKERLETFVTA